jgi:hypothetical protein
MAVRRNRTMMIGFAVRNCQKTEMADRVTVRSTSDDAVSIWIGCWRGRARGSAIRLCKAAILCSGPDSNNLPRGRHFRSI